MYMYNYVVHEQLYSMRLSSYSGTAINRHSQIEDTYIPNIGQKSMH